MKRILNITIAIILSTTCTTAASAQERISDSLKALREFAQLGQMYRHPSVRLMIHMLQTSNLPAGTSDSVQTDMDLYYSKPDFYMQAEGLEQISNDSIMLLVNKPAKRILLSRHDRQIGNGIERTLSMFMPDSSIQALSKRYRSAIGNAGDGRSLLTLTSREFVYGTDLPRETVRVIYHLNTHDLVEFQQIKTSLVPVDSAVFEQLRKQQSYQQQLVTTSTAKGKLFFMPKQLTITCRFDKIDYGLNHPPVTESDRLEKMMDGTYRPAKGFEDYILTNQL